MNPRLLLARATLISNTVRKNTRMFSSSLTMSVSYSSLK